MKGLKVYFFTILTVLLLFTLSPNLDAQHSGNRNAISLNGTWTDYYSLFKDDFLNTEFGTGGIKLGYHRNLVGDVLNLEVPFSVGGARVPYTRDFLNLAGDVSPKKLKASLGGLLQLQYFKKSNVIVPYLSAGVVGTYVADEGKWHAEIPLGLGLDFKVIKNGYFQIRPEYRLGLVDDDRNNLNLHVGFKYFLDGADSPPPPPPVDNDRDKDGVMNAVDKCPDVPGLPALGGCPDADGDGIADGDDACPNEAGVTKFNGCPDSDNDGLADNNDKCPNEAGPEANAGCPYGDADRDGVNDDIDLCKNTPGLAKFNGCPDSDSDGIPDNEDACPQEKGIAAMKGCPDSDGDGLANKDDKCPNAAGPKSNNGCPVVKEEVVVQEAISFAAKNIQFETNSNKIKAASLIELDNVASILAQYPDYNVSISGHTDSVGNAGYNKSLSQKRAKACLDYLVSKGVSAGRMSSAGYGEEQPIADNSTAEGRQMNRRVEFNIFKR